MTITQFLKLIDKATLAKVAKLPIREVEEEHQGHWVGFVDEKEECYDVQVKLQGSKIIEISCDCGVKPEEVCNHKIKMILSLEDLIKGKKVAEKPVGKKTYTKKKLKESVALLHEVGQEEVYNWIEELFKKDKNVEQEFILRFRKVEVRDYTSKEVDTIMLDIISKTIGKTKKEADVKTVRKLVDLFTLALAPIEDYLAVNITKPIALDIYLVVVSRLFTFNDVVYHTSTRVNTFKKKFAERFLRTLFNVKDKGAVENQLTSLRKKIEEQEDSSIKFHTLLDLVHEMEQFISKEYLHHFIGELVELRTHIEYNVVDYGSTKFINRFLFNIVFKNEVFKEYYTLFYPTIYDDEFNLELIKLVMDIDLGYAESMCHEIIDENLHFYSNEEVLRLLSNIVHKLGNKGKLLEIKKDIFYKTLNIEEYRFIIENCESIEEVTEFKAAVKKMLSKETLSGTMVDTYFEILHINKEYLIMLKKIHVNLDLKLIFTYIDQMYEADAKLLLDKIMMVGQGFNSAPSNKAFNEKCVDFVLRKYESGEILSKFSKYNAPSKSLNSKIKEALIAKQ